MPELLDASQKLISSEFKFLSDATSRELTAVTKETQAYYYMRRAKFAAALQYIIAATNIYKTSDLPYKFISTQPTRQSNAKSSKESVDG